MIQTSSTPTFTKGDTPDDQLFTFEDIEKYTFVRVNGDPGYVIDKGSHLEDAINARHVLIEFLDEDRDSFTIHEKLVNERLYKKRKLWVDWTGGLNPHGGYNDA